MAISVAKDSMSKPSAEPSMTASRVCPICNRPLSEETQAVRFRPFCSRRCADVDLGRWLKGAYTIPAVESAEETEAEATPAEGGGRV